MDPRDIPLERLIAERYPLPEWVTLFEFSSNHRRADAVAFNCWSSRGFHRLAFECKRTRQDFLREVDEPGKRKWLEELFHQTYFVVSPDIIKQDEVPEGWGLYVATKKGDKLIRRIAPKHREVARLPEYLAMRAIRLMAEQVARERSHRVIFEGKELTPHDLKNLLDEQLEVERAAYRNLMQNARRLNSMLERRRNELQAPLTAMARAAKDYGLYRDVRKGDCQIKVEDVHRWIEMINTDAIARFRRDLKQTHARIGELLGNIERVAREKDEVKDE